MAAKSYLLARIDGVFAEEIHERVLRKKISTNTQRKASGCEYFWDVSKQK
jgi:hypothetical protein